MIDVIDPPIDSASAKTKPRFSEEADAFLDEYYAKFGSTTARQKINALTAFFTDERDNIPAEGNEIEEARQLGHLEYQFLDFHGKYQLTLA